MFPVLCHWQSIRKKKKKKKKKKKTKKKQQPKPQQKKKKKKKNKTQNKTIFSCEKQKESFDKEEGGEKWKRNKFNRRD